MNKNLIAGMLIAIPSVLSAQTAVDAYSISQSDLRGTARFMSMGGAFTALGGDISTLNQNPAGIGVYRSSELSATLDINMQSAKTVTGNLVNKMNQTKVACNNFGYVGTVNLNSETMPFFNWGASYSRVVSFDRRYSGTIDVLGTSLTNLVANNINNYAGGPLSPGQLDFTSENDPYLPYGRVPWLGALMYQSGGISPLAPGGSAYTGLYEYGYTDGMGSYLVEDRGHIDEYSINFGGNILNTVYWGIGFGITDIDFQQTTDYYETLTNANVPDGNREAPSYVAGDGSLGLGNYKHIWGSGFNFKAGVIFKPINELRFGLAVHTPTYYNLSYEGIGYTDYRYTSPHYPEDAALDGNGSTNDGYYGEFDWKLQSPWRLMAGVAGVIGGRGIISLDYEYRAYSDMRVKDWNGNEYKDYTQDVKTYYQATNILRLGAEYRVTPGFSVRAGYSYESSPVKSALLDPSGSEATYVYTSGPDDIETQPAFTLDRTTQYITCGIGYRYKSFYADAAFVHRTRKSDYHAFSDYNEWVESEQASMLVQAPKAKLTNNDNSIVLTVGIRF